MFIGLRYVGEYYLAWALISNDERECFEHPLSEDDGAGSAAGSAVAGRQADAVTGGYRQGACISPGLTITSIIEFAAIG